MSVNTRTTLTAREHDVLRSRAQPSAKTNNKPPIGGLPHSEICGSMPIRGSPQLIAAYHVLHRLLSPRHPPNALLALDPIQKKAEPFCIGLPRFAPLDAIRRQISKPSKPAQVFTDQKILLTKVQCSLRRTNPSDQCQDLCMIIIRLPVSANGNQRVLPNPVRGQPGLNPCVFPPAG